MSEIDNNNLIKNDQEDCEDCGNIKYEKDDDSW